MSVHDRFKNIFGHSSYLHFSVEREKERNVKNTVNFSITTVQYPLKEINCTGICNSRGRPSATFLRT